MIPIQKDKIAEIARADHLLSGVLVGKEIRVHRGNEVKVDSIAFTDAAEVQKCESVGHCILGALLFNAGISNEELISLPSNPEQFHREHVKLLKDTYGLHRYHQKKLMEANDADHGDESTAVLERVLEELEDLAKAQAESPNEDRFNCHLADDSWYATYTYDSNGIAILQPYDDEDVFGGPGDEPW